MNAPVYDMLKSYVKNNPLPFHMPGHILGRGLIEELKNAGRLDITEIPGSDCLHYPEEALKDAQTLASKCFGADYSLFLVNGSTSGIHIMIRAIVKPGDKLIIGRDCHISVLNALALINAEPVFVRPKIDNENQIPLGASLEDMKKAVSENPDARGILITRPNYYGIAVSLKDIAKLAKEYGMALLVDEAHGAHFCFHPHFPAPSIQNGADLCVQSLHKTLPALTQTALLHGRNSGLNLQNQAQKLSSMIQTTSPSYIFMASIDAARALMEKEGRELYQKLWDNVRRFETELEKRTCIRRVKISFENYETDFSRIVLSFNNTSLSGYEAEEILRTRYGIVAEMADLYNLVLIATPFHAENDFDRLIEALEKISEDYRGKPKTINNVDFYDYIPRRAVPLHIAALYSEKREIPLNQSVGLVCGEAVIPYPPGIPVLNPGEEISTNVVEYLNGIIRLGCSVHGVKDGKIYVLNI